MNFKTANEYDEDARIHQAHEKANELTRENVDRLKDSLRTLNSLGWKLCEKLGLQFDVELAKEHRRLKELKKQA